MGVPPTACLHVFPYDCKHATERAYRYRVYPLPDQASVLGQTFGCARFVYKWALLLRTDAYYERHERIG
ncbi:MAG TPA: helix-turn-helix domain-containing protein [Ktedonobacterales bacterium]